MNGTLEMPIPATRPMVSNLPKREIQILLVEEDHALRQVLQRLLTDEDYLVLTADSGTEVLEMVGTLNTDLVLLNVNLPANDGLETLEQLMFRHPQLPIVLIAAHPNQFYPAIALGVGALLEKPFDFVDLLNTVRQLLVESDEQRLARVAQHPGMFHYIPSRTAGAGETQRYQLE